MYKWVTQLVVNLEDVYDFMCFLGVLLHVILDSNYYNL